MLRRLIQIGIEQGVWTEMRKQGKSGALLAVLFMAIMAGCTSPAREQVFEPRGPTVESIWHGSNAGTGLAAEIVGFNAGGQFGAARWTRDAESELDALFPELDNPRINLYVFPHLSPGGHPVPGYLTHFHLYESTRNWALPGEAFREGKWQ